MKNKLDVFKNYVAVLVYAYLIYPSVKWLFFVSSEQKEVLMGDYVDLITYISLAIGVCGMLSIIVLMLKIFKKIETNSWIDLGITVLMINVIIEGVILLGIFTLSATRFVSNDILFEIINYNMYISLVLQVIATALIVSGGVVSLKRVK